LRGARDHNGDDLVLGVHRSGKWIGISLRTQSKVSESFDYPLYLVVNTKDGPKVLLDIDLRYATNKGRKLINSRNWKKLKNTLPEDSLTHIQTLFNQHEKLSKTDLSQQEE
jgi:hypothetical protein